METTASQTTIPLKGMRRAAARQMVRAWEAPAFALTAVVDMERLLQTKPAGVTVSDQLVHAAGQTLQRHPAINAWYADEAVTSFAKANVGLAVATDAGLIVPVIHDAGSLELEETAAIRSELVAKARARGLGMDDVSGGTFTISNLGMQGIDRFTAIVNAPQVAILAVGATTERYTRRGGTEQWRRQADFTVSFDHRAVDGATGAAFLADLRQQIEGERG